MCWWYFCCCSLAWADGCFWDGSSADGADEAIIAVVGAAEQAGVEALEAGEDSAALEEVVQVAEERAEAGKR